MYEILNLPIHIKYLKHQKILQSILKYSTKIILQKCDPSLTVLSNMCVDIKTIKRNLKFKLDGSKRLEASPRRGDIRAIVHQNIKLSAERMKGRYPKKNRLFVKLFQIWEKVEIKIPKEYRSKVDTKRLQSVIKHKTLPMHKLD